MANLLETAILEFILQLPKGSLIYLCDMQAELKKQQKDVSYLELIKVLLRFCEPEEGRKKYVDISVEKGHDFHFVRV